MDKIIAALLQLNPKNDNHWMADGLPKLESVRFFAADQSITLEQVTAAKPGFTREIAEASVVIVPPVTDTAVTSVAAATPQGASNVQEPDRVSSDVGVLGDEEEQEDPKASLAEKLARARQRLAKIGEAKAKVQKAYADQDATVNRLIEEVEAAGGGEKFNDHLSAYFAQQHASRAERIERQLAIRRSGINLAELLQTKSPLDASMQRKTRRGGQRVPYPLLVMQE